MGLTLVQGVAAVTIIAGAVVVWAMTLIALLTNL
jgi:hypothetical protein